MCTQSKQNCSMCKGGIFSASINVGNVWAFSRVHKGGTLGEKNLDEPLMDGHVEFVPSWPKLGMFHSHWLIFRFVHYLCPLKVKDMHLASTYFVKWYFGTAEFKWPFRFMKYQSKKFAFTIPTRAGRKYIERAIKKFPRAFLLKFVPFDSMT